MPVKKAAIKALRQTKKRTERNKSIKLAIKKGAKVSVKSLATGNREQAWNDIYKTLKALDKASQKGIIHKNTAARKKSRLMKKFNAIPAKA